MTMTSPNLFDQPMPLFYEGPEAETAKVHTPHKESFEPVFPKLQLHEETQESFAAEPRKAFGPVYAFRCVGRGIRRRPRISLTLCCCTCC